MAKIVIDKANIAVNGGGKVQMQMLRNGDVVDIVGRSRTVVGHVELPNVTVTVNDGTILNLYVEGDVTCGIVTGGVSAGGDVRTAEIGGNVSAGGDISCTGIGGNAQAGGDISCRGTVSGKSIITGGDMIVRS